MSAAPPPLSLAEHVARALSLPPGGALPPSALFTVQSTVEEPALRVRAALRDCAEELQDMLARMSSASVFFQPAARTAQLSDLSEAVSAGAEAATTWGIRDAPDTAGALVARALKMQQILGGRNGGGGSGGCRSCGDADTGMSGVGDAADDGGGGEGSPLAPAVGSAAAPAAAAAGAAAAAAADTAHSAAAGSARALRSPLLPSPPPAAAAASAPAAAAADADVASPLAFDATVIETLPLPPLPGGGLSVRASRPHLDRGGSGSGGGYNDD